MKKKDLEELLELADAVIAVYSDFVEQLPTCESDLLGDEGYQTVLEYYRKTKSFRGSDGKIKT